MSGSRNEQGNSGSKKSLLYFFLTVLVILATVNVIIVWNPFVDLWSEGVQVADDQSGLDDFVSPNVKSTEPVEVETSKYRLTYSADFADIVEVREQEGESGPDLVFYARLSGSNVVVYTLHYNSDVGNLVFERADAAGNSVPFAIVTSECPLSAVDNDEMIFYMAQETLNEIAESLELK